MTRITRTAGCALVPVFLSLSAFTAANAQVMPYKYGFCYGVAGNPRVECQKLRDQIASAAIR